VTESSTEQEEPKVLIQLVKDYVFRATFSGTNTVLLMDEPSPLGSLVGPNASRILSAAVGNCLSASLAFCLRKSKVDLIGMKTEVTPTVERNKEGYWRVVKMSAEIKVEVGESTESSRLQRCLEIFENYCVVTGAVRNGIKVDVKVNSATSDGPTTETHRATT
jgi:uncharacterized OsmC-like protein